MRSKIGMFVALAAAVLSLLTPSEKKEIIKKILSVSISTNSR